MEKFIAGKNFIIFKNEFASNVKVRGFFVPLNFEIVYGIKCNIMHKNVILS